jgi:hypothetical protein
MCSTMACLSSLYCMGVELWAKPYGIKLRCYWECLEEQLGNLGKPLGTWWEQKKKNIKSSTSKKKKTRPLMSACWDFSLAAWNFCFQNCLAWANGRVTNCGTESSQMPSIWSTYVTSELLLQLCRLRPFWNWLHCIQCLPWL